jgi:hypothetical protein
VLTYVRKKFSNIGPWGQELAADLLQTRFQIILASDVDKIYRHDRSRKHNLTKG